MRSDNFWAISELPWARSVHHPMLRGRSLSRPSITLLRIDLRCSAFRCSSAFPENDFLVLKARRRILKFLLRWSIAFELCSRTSIRLFPGPQRFCSRAQPLAPISLRQRRALERGDDWAVVAVLPFG